MKQLEQMYEGKAKKVYATDDPNLVIVDYKDDATAFNGLKKGTIAGKGAINNRMTNYLMKQLEEQGIPTHFVKEIDDRKTVVKKVDIIPLEVIIRNRAAGSFSKRLGIPEGSDLRCSTLEFSYKDDDLGDPLINSYMAKAIGAATQEEIDVITDYVFRVNDLLKSFFISLLIYCANPDILLIACAYLVRETITESSLLSLRYNASASIASSVGAEPVTSIFASPPTMALST